MTEHTPDPADGDRATNRTADDPFDRKRLERLREIANPKRPEQDPLAEVDTASVSPGDGGSTGPDEMDDLNWDEDVTLEGDIQDPDSTTKGARPAI